MLLESIIWQHRQSNSHKCPWEDASCLQILSHPQRPTSLISDLCLESRPPAFIEAEWHSDNQSKIEKGKTGLIVKGDPSNSFMKFRDRSLQSIAWQALCLLFLQGQMCVTKGTSSSTALLDLMKLFQKIMEQMATQSFWWYQADTMHFLNLNRSLQTNNLTIYSVRGGIQFAHLKQFSDV